MNFTHAAPKMLQRNNRHSTVLATISVDTCKDTIVHGKSIHREDASRRNADAKTHTISITASASKVKSMRHVGSLPKQKIMCLVPIMRSLLGIYTYQDDVEKIWTPSCVELGNHTEVRARSATKIQGSPHNHNTND